MVRFSAASLVAIACMATSSTAWNTNTFRHHTTSSYLHPVRTNSHAQQQISNSLSSVNFRAQQQKEQRTKLSLSLNDGDEIVNQITDKIGSTIQQLTTKLSSLKEINLNVEIVGLQNAVKEVISTISAIDWSDSKALATAVSALYTAFDSNLGPLFSSIPAPVAVVLTATLTYSVVSSILSFGNPPPPSSPYPLKKYDAVKAREYFDSRLDETIMRAIEVGFLSARFGASLLGDYLNKKLDVNAEQRAEELTDLLTVLGPSFIKIGQSISIRTDLLSPAYIRGLKKLQDQVPAFASSEAYSIMEEEFGVSNIYEVFSKIGSEPIAAASLGQVYKATLQPAYSPTGEAMEVAVKVQRPDIMNKIALDMHLIREIAPILKANFNLNTDLAGTVDAWGIGFVDELNYLDEATNANKFTEGIQKTPLANVVFAPQPIEQCSTEKVLTTEWVEGERLDRSSKSDVTVLCSIAMNTYLTMMLETGLLHCDPHPGNLLRTQDGKLCILDWGMVTRLDPNLQITLIEHMAHLTSRDYDEIPRDLLLLGFIPESKKDLITDSGIVETLAEIYGAWTNGGGAAAVNVNQVVQNLQDLTAEKGNLFQIPPYFAYIAKSFSVLEGIGLSNDEKYSIINECLPYVSKRLLTDDNERTGGALATFIFGPSKSDLDSRIVDYDRVEQLVNGFGNYSTSASGALLGKEDATRVEMFEDAADQILELLIREEETPLQAILIEQLAKIISSGTRSLWTDLRERSGTLPSGRSVLGTLVDPSGLWRTSPVVRMNDLDVKTVETTRKLIGLVQEQSTTQQVLVDAQSLSNEEVVELSRLLVRKLWEKRRGLALTGGRLTQMLVKMTADKLEKGQRDVLILSKKEDESEENDGVVDTDMIPEAIPVSKSKPSSDRLENARALLAGLE